MFCIAVSMTHLKMNGSSSSFVYSFVISYGCVLIWVTVSQFHQRWLYTLPESTEHSKIKVFYGNGCFRVVLWCSLVVI